MKQDLDRLMEERELDALVVMGKMIGNPALYYMVNGAAILSGTVVQKRGAAPILLASPIEREEAAASGLTVVNTSKYDFTGILREKGDQLAASVEYYRRVFADLGVGGRVGWYGMSDPGSAWQLLNALNEQLEGIEVRGEFGRTLLDVARATKDAPEAERIREVGRRSTEIVRQTIEFLRSHGVRDRVLVQADGEPLTVGAVHKQIGVFVAEHGLDVPDGVIFATGRDAGVPHNKGDPQAVLRLGQSIVFDFAARELGGGYHFDITRSFCLGYAPPEVEMAFQEVLECQQRAIDGFRVGAELRLSQRMACEFFEGRGHPTVGSDPRAESGYVHGLSHGIGLAVHEEPYSSDTPTNTVVIQPGHIFTCEPGLYYPDRGFGVRLEDVIWIDALGKVRNLTDCPKELVVRI